MLPSQAGVWRSPPPHKLPQDVTAGTGIQETRLQHKETALGLVPAPVSFLPPSGLILSLSSSLVLSLSLSIATHRCQVGKEQRGGCRLRPPFKKKTIKNRRQEASFVCVFNLAALKQSNKFPRLRFHDILKPLGLAVLVCILPLRKSGAGGRPCQWQRRPLAAPKRLFLIHSSFPQMCPVLCCILLGTTVKCLAHSDSGNLPRGGLCAP